MAATATAMFTAVAALVAAISTVVSVRAFQVQTDIAERGQFAERYTKAVEHIGQQGADHLQTRLGGVYALERLARDSSDDQAIIVEVLSAFVRTNAPSRGVTVPDGGSRCPEQSVLPDVQAALTVLGRRDTQYDKGTRVDLRRTCLRTAELTGAVLAGANLELADLRGSNLTRARLGAAYLYGALFNGALLDRVDLRGATLTGADLSAVDLRRADYDSATEVTGVRVDGRTVGKWW